MFYPIDQIELFRQSMESLKRQQGDLAPSSSSLLQQVVGLGGTADGYLYGGFTTSLGLRGVLQYLGRDPSSFGSILDFGCGSARVIRWFADLVGESRLMGIDISPEAVAWAKENVPFVDFGVNAPHPPLPLADNSLDFVFGISVMTHLDEDFQNVWLEELARVVRPGGLVLLSVHSPLASRQGLGVDALDELRERGIWFQSASDATVEDLPDFYQICYHDRDYIERTWSRYFDVELLVSHGPWYRQESIIMTPKAAGNSQIQLPKVELAMAALDDPRPGAVRQGNLRLTGWMFSPTGRPVDPQLLVDGTPVEADFRWFPRPELEEIFLTELASRGGFSADVAIADLTPGFHTVWLTDGDPAIPITATYFRVE